MKRAAWCVTLCLVLVAGGCATNAPTSAPSTPVSTSTETSSTTPVPPPPTPSVSAPATEATPVGVKTEAAAAISRLCVLAPEKGWASSLKPTSAPGAVAVAEGGELITMNAARTSLTWHGPQGTQTIATATGQQNFANVLAGQGQVVYRLRHGFQMTSQWTWFSWKPGEKPTQIATSDGKDGVNADAGLFARPVIGRQGIWWNRTVAGHYAVSQFDDASHRLSNVAEANVVEGMVEWGGQVLGRTGVPGQPERARFFDVKAPTKPLDVAPSVRSLRFVSGEGEWLFGGHGKRIAWESSTTRANLDLPIALDVNDNVSVSAGFAVVTSNEAYPYLIDLRTGAMAGLLPAGQFGVATVANGWLLVHTSGPQGVSKVAKLADLGTKSC